MVTIKEQDYLKLIENSMLVETMKIAGVEKLPIWKAVMRVMEDDRVQIHIKPLSKKYRFD